MISGSCERRIVAEHTSLIDHLDRTSKHEHPEDEM
jgi:hypothetical protein